MRITQKRQRELLTDFNKAIVRTLHAAACERFGADVVKRDRTMVWTMRCIWGMENKLSFNSPGVLNLSELLWMLDQVGL